MMRTVRSSFRARGNTDRRGARQPRLLRGDVDGLGALVAGLGVVGDLRALGQRLEAVGVDAGVVDEQVLATLVGRDEAEALVVVEPLHGSGRHVIPPWLVCTANAEDAAERQRLRALIHAGAERRALDLNAIQPTA